MDASSGVRGRYDVCVPFHQHPGEKLGQGPVRHMRTCVPREGEHHLFYIFVLQEGKGKSILLIEGQQSKLRGQWAVDCKEILDMANTWQPCGNWVYELPFLMRELAAEATSPTHLLATQRDLLNHSPDNPICLPKTESLKTFK